MIDINGDTVIAICKVLHRYGNADMLETDDRMIHACRCADRIIRRIRAREESISCGDIIHLLSMCKVAAFEYYPYSTLFFKPSGLKYFKMKFRGWVVTVVEPNREKLAIRVQVYLSAPNGETVLHGRVFDSKTI